MQKTDTSRQMHLYGKNMLKNPVVFNNKSTQGALLQLIWIGVMSLYSLQEDITE